MFNSATEILKQYLNDITPLSVRSIYLERGDNTPDSYYICDVNGEPYVVFETDYIGPTPYQIDEIREILANEKVEYIGWLVRIDKFKNASQKILPPDVPLGTEANYELLVTGVGGTPLNCAVLALRHKTH